MRGIFCCSESVEFGQICSMYVKNFEASFWNFDMTKYIQEECLKIANKGEKYDVRNLMSIILLTRSNYQFWNHKPWSLMNLLTNQIVFDVENPKQISKQDKKNVF